MPRIPTYKSREEDDHYLEIKPRVTKNEACLEFEMSAHYHTLDYDAAVRLMMYLHGVLSTMRSIRLDDENDAAMLEHYNTEDESLGNMLDDLLKRGAGK